MLGGQPRNFLPELQLCRGSFWFSTTGFSIYALSRRCVDAGCSPDKRSRGKPVGSHMQFAGSVCFILP